MKFTYTDVRTLLGSVSDDYTNIGRIIEILCISVWRKLERPTIVGGIHI